MSANNTLAVGDKVRLEATVRRVPPLATHDTVVLYLTDFAWTVDESDLLISSSRRGRPSPPPTPAPPVMSSVVEIEVIWVEPSLGLAKGMDVTVGGTVTETEGETVTIEIEGYTKLVTGPATGAHTPRRP